MTMRRVAYIALMGFVSMPSYGVKTPTEAPTGYNDGQTALVRRIR